MAEAKRNSFASYAFGSGAGRVVRGHEHAMSREPCLSPRGEESSRIQRGLAWLTPIVAQLLEDRGSNLQWLEAHLGSGLLRGCSGRPRKFLPWHCGKRRNSCQMCAAAADRSVPKAPPGAKTAAAAPAAAAAAPRALYLLLLLLLLLVVKQLRKNHHPAGKHHASEGRASSKTAPQNSLTCRLKS